MKTAHSFDEGSVYKSFTDVFMVIAIVLIFAITLTKANNIDAQAEYLASIEWSAKANADVDFYVKVDNGDERSSYYIWFRNKSTHGVYLDRDSRGFSDDKVTIGGKTEYLPHRETISIRGEVARKMIFGIQLYSFQLDPVDEQRTLQDLHLNVHFELVKINPTVKTIFTADKKLTKVSDADNIVAIQTDGQRFKFIDVPLNPISDQFAKNTDTNTTVSPYGTAPMSPVVPRTP